MRAGEWRGEAGLIREKVPGGFKALRSTCLQVLDNPRKKWWLLSGRTGSAKTVLIQALPQSVDLEGLANHRGSAFGRRLTPQPTPVTFENALAVDYLHHSFESLIVEDESRTIGRIGLPPAWHAQMQQAPIALVEATLEERIEHIHTEYVQDARVEYAEAGLAETELQTRYEDAVLRIKRRLGGVRLTELTHLIQQAFSHQCDHRERHARTRSRTASGFDSCYGLGEDAADTAPGLQAGYLLESPPSQRSWLLLYW